VSDILGRIAHGQALTCQDLDRLNIGGAPHDPLRQDPHDETSCPCVRANPSHGFREHGCLSFGAASDEMGPCSSIETFAGPMLVRLCCRCWDSWRAWDQAAGKYRPGTPQELMQAIREAIEALIVVDVSPRLLPLNEADRQPAVTDLRKEQGFEGGRRGGAGLLRLAGEPARLPGA
jgi:hypothetical protein